MVGASTETWVAILHMGIIVSIVGHGLWYRLVPKYRTNQTMPFTLLIPVFGVSFGIVLLGETLTWLIFAGGLVTLAGVAIVYSGNRNPRQWKHHPQRKDDVNIQDCPSPNLNDRSADGAIDMVVLHYTGMQSARAALERMCDPAAEVSAHYMVDEDGGVFRLVLEDKSAWHAGVSYWQGATDINDRSVGIEIVNPGHEFGYRPFTAHRRWLR